VVQRAGHHLLLGLHDPHELQQREESSTNWCDGRRREGPRIFL
jgi:hypothetical protein